jgi:hypothetical protein
VHADLKQAIPRQAPAHSQQQLKRAAKRAAIGHMRRLSKRPERIRSIFRNQRFRYAA